MKEHTNSWTFSRIGGVDQVVIRNGTDVAGLAKLDQKLWAVLAMPTGLPDLKESLEYLDEDRDGKIRVPDILRTIDELKGKLKNLDALFEQNDHIGLDQLSDEHLREAISRVLTIAKADEGPSASAAKQTSIDSVDLQSVEKAITAFSSLPFNGDGVVTKASFSDEAAREFLSALIEAGFSKPDANGDSGVDEPGLDRFIAELERYKSWAREDAFAKLFASEEEGQRAFGLFQIVRAPVDDYFKRCGILAMAGDSSVMNDLTALMASILSRNLPENSEELARLPLALPDEQFLLHLDGALHPSFSSAVHLFFALTAKDLSIKMSVSQSEWAKIAEKMEAYGRWLSEKPNSGVCSLGQRFLDGKYTAETLEMLRQFIRDDLAMAEKAESLKELRRLIFLKRDFLSILGNFVNLDDFYVRKRGLFRSGKLYIDGRELELCMDVRNPQAHASMAGLSSMYLIYCDLFSKDGRKKSIVAALTAGDADNIFVGRNGVFYDSEGLDWDAVVAKIIIQPISIHEAFFSPYKWLARTIEEYAMKRAANAEAANMDKLKGVAQATALAGKPESKPEQFVPKKIDVGTVAAIGVALGSIGAMVTGILGMFFGMGAWMPLGILGVFILISGPSMILAYMKLRKRNIGPLLNAEGWAVNSRLKINVPFGATLSHIAALPLGARRQIKDPFAEKKKPWAVYAVIFFVVLLIVAYLIGWLDPFLRSV